MPIVGWIFVLGLAAFVGAMYFACAVSSSQVLGPALVRGPSDIRRVALTFDDGPAPPFTEQILDILRHRKVPATFFVCGKNAEHYPEIVRRIQAEGHALGNHTYSHPHLWLCSTTRMSEEIDRTQEAIEKITGYRPNMFRPPYGVRWFGIFSVLRQRSMTMVQWSDTGYDWKCDSGEIVRQAVRTLGPGSIILLHDGRECRTPNEVNRSRTVRALPLIIDFIERAGFQFATVPELLADQS